MFVSHRFYILAAKFLICQFNCFCDIFSIFKSLAPVAKPARHLLMQMQSQIIIIIYFYKNLFPIRFMKCDFYSTMTKYFQPMRQR